MKAQATPPAPTKVSKREFMRNMAQYVKRTHRGESFVVLNRNVPDFAVAPVVMKKKYTLADLAAFRFKGGKNLSRDIDTILYGKRTRR